jgi:hypothetical protein
MRKENNGLRQDEGVDGNEPQEVSSTTLAGTQKVSQAGF